MFSDSETIWTALITVISSFITGIAAWIAGGRKREAELKEKAVQITNLQTEGMNQIMKQYQVALDDLEKRYEDRYEYLKKEYEARHTNLVEDYERKYVRLKDEKHGEIVQLKKEIESLRKNLELWKKKYQDLKKEIDERNSI